MRRGLHDRNRGDRRPGDQNRGDQKQGDRSPGNQNRGDQRPGDQNRGDEKRDDPGQPPGAPPPELRQPAPSPVRSWQPRRVAALVAVVGFAVTGLATWAAWSAHHRSRAKLLKLEARQAASALSAALPAIQSQLADALTVAQATGSPVTFQRFLSGKVGKNGVASESLWEQAGSGFRLVANVGSPPALVGDHQATRFFATVRPSTALQVTGILSGSPPRVGYLEFPPGASRWVVYAESVLPASRRLRVPGSSPFGDLDFAFYLGRAALPSQLIEASVPTPITASHATVVVPFGDSALTLVATPRASLTAGVSRDLPWMVAGAGVVLSLAAAVLVEHLARRRRLADELNARLSELYAEQRSIALTLQHSLLPEHLPSVAGVTLAARYFPGASGVEIGGDWYDVVVLDPERFVFVVGDVSGRGVRAGTVMASLRFASRAFALEGHSPARILTELNKTLDFAADGCFATVLCGLVHVPRRQVTLASAGHLPPIVLPPIVRGGGPARTLPVRAAPPIGVSGRAPDPEPPVQLPARARLFAYTDGLVERRGRSLAEGIEQLEESTGQQARSLDALLDSIVSDLTMDNPADDVALLGLEWTS